MILPTEAAGFCPDVTRRQKVGGEREGENFAGPFGGVNWGLQSAGDAVGEPGSGDKSEIRELENGGKGERKGRVNVPECSRPSSDVGVRG